LWGDENHARDLLGDVATRKDVLRVDTFSGPEEFRDFFKKNYGPTIAVYRNIAGDPDRTQALDRDLLELAERYGSGSEPFTMEWEYLLVTATPDGGGA
ncbi:MAG: SAM-dependent methyltransferase, partial [Rhodococcus sp. (in: high G+C Gram-positive bacteria)]|nr:SAM-dependent methyltransferase [Rhodococcus sp. (in: high G+C Gram-positive bacteria)]